MGFVKTRFFLIKTRLSTYELLKAVATLGGEKAM